MPRPRYILATDGVIFEAEDNDTERLEKLFELYTRMTASQVKAGRAT